MDFNFADLKREAAATGEDIFSNTDPSKQTATLITQGVLDGAAKVAATSEDVFGKTDPAKQAAKMTPQEIFDGGAEASPGRQDDNAHTEQYFANEKRDLGFEHVDPQTFVQRMSAGAKEAQEELDAKFAQHSNDFDVLHGGAPKKVDAMGTQQKQDVKQGVISLTKDFMNVERGLFGGAGDVSAAKPALPAEVPATAPAVAIDDLLGVGDGHFAPTAPAAPSNTFADNDFSGSSLPKSSASNNDSDTDSPSVSYNPSPVKKLPIADALKEQDNEKFISSEDLLGDFKEERVATPDFKPASAPTTITSVIAGADAKPTIATSTAASIPTTDLDAEEEEEDDDDDEGFILTTTPAPATITVASRVAPAAPAAAVLKPAAASEPPKPQPAPAKIETQPVEDTKPATVVTMHNKEQQPNIISVEEIFYKYGLDAWFKPERLHPLVESLIYWRDVKKSGIVFGAGLVILLAISCFSVISVFAYLSLLTLTGTVAFRIYKSVMQAIQKTSDGHPFKDYLNIQLELSQDKVQNIVAIGVAHVNGIIAELRRLFLVEDLVDSIKFGVILWVMTYLGAWFNGMTLVILAFVSLFTLPKVYENNKQSIDTYLDLVRSKLTEITDKIKVAIPIGNKKPIAAETEKDK